MVDKKTVLDALDLCIFRKSNNLNCISCKYRDKCTEVHAYAKYAVMLEHAKSVKEVMAYDENRTRRSDYQG